MLSLGNLLAKLAEGVQQGLVRGGGPDRPDRLGLEGGFPLASPDGACQLIRFPIDDELGLLLPVQDTPASRVPPKAPLGGVVDLHVPELDHLVNVLLPFLIREVPSGAVRL